MKISYNDLLATLTSFPALKPLKESFLPHLIDITEVRHFQKGDVVMVQGEYEELCCFVLSGSVQTRVKNKEGKSKKKYTLKKVAFFGEMATLSPVPRAAGVRCKEKTTLLYLNKNALFSLMDHSNEFKNMVHQKYRKTFLCTDLKKNNLFSGLPDNFFSELERITQIRTYKHDETLLSPQNTSNDFLIILHGFARVLLPENPKQQTSLAENAFKVSGYLEPGDHFGDIPLLAKRPRVSIVQAITRLHILKIDGPSFEIILEKYLQQNELLRQVITNRKKQTFKFPNDKEDQKFLDWAISSHIVDSESVLLIDLDRCVRCETCITTCKFLHGDSRLRLTGYTYRNILIPTSCRHCTDPECLKGCPTGAIYRNFSGEVVHKSTCIACNNCVKNCPWHNIALVDRKKHQKRPLFSLLNKNFWKKRIARRGSAVEVVYNKKENRLHSQAEPQKKLPIPKIAATCNNCQEYSKMGCVQNCPTGATKSVRPRKYFKQLKKDFMEKK
ncbi:MAG: cyclic nucleotide-binding domain-containing protein [Nitrospinota bacterium]